MRYCGPPRITENIDHCTRSLTVANDTIAVVPRGEVDAGPRGEEAR